MTSLLAQVVKKKNHLQCRRPGFSPWAVKIRWRRKWLPTPVFLPGESYGQRNLVGYSPWDRKELDMTKQLTCAACEVLIPWPGVESVLPAVEEQSLNSWTFGEVPFLILWSKGKGYIIISWLPVLTCRGGAEGKGENWIYQSPNLFTSTSSEAPRKCTCSSNRNEHLSPCIVPWRCSLS